MPHNFRSQRCFEGKNGSEQMSPGGHRKPWRVGSTVRLSLARGDISPETPARSHRAAPGGRTRTISRCPSQPHWKVVFRARSSTPSGAIAGLEDVTVAVASIMLEDQQQPSRLPRCPLLLPVRHINPLQQKPFHQAGRIILIGPVGACPFSFARSRLCERPFPFHTEAQL